MPVYHTYFCKRCLDEATGGSTQGINTREIIATLGIYEDYQTNPPNCKLCSSMMLILFGGLEGTLALILPSEQEERDLRSRYARRNKKILSWPKPQQERMKRFCKKYGVREYVSGQDSADTTIR